MHGKFILDLPDFYGSSIISFFSTIRNFFKILRGTGGDTATDAGAGDSNNNTASDKGCRICHEEVRFSVKSKNTPVKKIIGN